MAKKTAVKILLWTILLFLFVGCNPTVVEEINSQPAITQSRMKETLPSPIPIRNLNFDTVPDNTLSLDQIPSQCNKTLTFKPAGYPPLKGFVVYDLTTKELKILSDTWKDDPIYVIKNDQPTSNFVGWAVSPDNQWIAYIDLMRADNFDIWVENPISSRQIKKHIEGMTIGTNGLHWGNKELIVIPLRNKGDQFEWLLWNPFSQEERIVSVEIPHGREMIEKYSIFPIYEPNTNSILSPCLQCEEYEYQVLTLDSKSLPWFIDFGSGLFTTPKWEPNISFKGDVTAFYFGLNKLWIINNNGESSIKVVLPFGSDENWPMKTYKWSNNGEYLAMIRDNENSLNPYLSILSINDQKLIDFCNDIPYGTLVWSHDDQYIAVSSNRTANEAESTLLAINVKTGQGEKYLFPNNLSLVGWMEP